MVKELLQIIIVTNAKLILNYIWIITEFQIVMINAIIITILMI